jgi:hypothetical protein
VVSLLILGVLYPQANLAGNAWGAIKWNCWLVENSEQSG